MLIRLQPAATPTQIQAMRQLLFTMGYETVALEFLGRRAYSALPREDCDAIPQAEAAAPLRRQFGGIAEIEPSAGTLLVSRAARISRTRVRVGPVVVGGDEVVLVAGPCSVESREQVLATALAARAAGAHLLRGGAYKPRTSTYAFQGMGRRGLAWLAEAGQNSGLPVVTEVMAPEDVELVAEHADVLQVGARNMQNFPLLKRLGRLRRPVLLKRAPSATLEEWLSAAEYLVARGNDQVMLCERGIRGFDPYTRNTLDLAAVAALRELTHLPILADPSHGTGRRSLIAPTAAAALAAGADGVCIEVHIKPDESVSDREQAISPLVLARMVPSLRAVAAAVGRGWAAVPEGAADDLVYSTTCRAV